MMTTKRMLYWVDGAIEEHDYNHGYDDKMPARLIDCYCVDKACTTVYRYGGYTKNEHGIVNWAYTPLENFPVEFQMQLILLDLDNKTYVDAL